MRALSRGWLLCAVALVSLSGCDDPKKDTPKPAPSAAVTAVASTPQVASAVPSASVEAPKAKAPIVCGTGPELDTKDAGLAEEIRRKLGKKPGEPVKNSELATIRSLNLIKAAVARLKLTPRTRVLGHEPGDECLVRSERVHRTRVACCLSHREIPPKSGAVVTLVPELFAATVPRK